MGVIYNPLLRNRKVMTDTNNTIENKSETSEVIDTPSKKTNRIYIAIAIIVIIISSAVAMFGFYLYQSLSETNADYKQKIQILATQLESQVAQQNQQFQDNKNLNEKFKAQVQQLNSQLLDTKNKNKLYSSDVQALQRSIAETNIRHPSDWILSEVEYLINLSGRKLWLEHDLKTTISLLAAADQRVVEMADPSLNPLRRALLEDINMLEALPKRDIDRVILALSSLERRIDKLSIAGLEMPEMSENADTDISTDVGDWQDNLGKSWNVFIESFIVISHRDTPVEALLSPEQAWYLKENLRNHLSKAEFAIYREQQDIYDIAMQNAMQLVELYYDMSDNSTQQFYDSIKRLSTQKVSVTYPDQFKSAPLLARIMKQRISKSVVIEKAE